jgi:hypothetical protein
LALVDNLWLAALTKDEDEAGTDEGLNLTINIDGGDVFDQDFTLGGGLGQGQAGLEESGLLTTPFESSALTNSSIRLGIRGDEAWGPYHVLLIGQTQPAFEPGRVVALAMETDLTDWLSSDSSEGHLTMRLRLVAPGASGTVIRRVLLLVYTDGENDAETDNAIQLQIAAGGNLVLHQTIGDTPQDDLEPSTANWYFLDVDTPFTRGDIASNGSIRLSIVGTDAWLPRTVFVFGLDTETGRPNEVVMLASIPEWDLGWLSADPQEGNQSVDLPLSI